MNTLMQSVRKRKQAAITESSTGGFNAPNPFRSAQAQRYSLFPSTRTVGDAILCGEHRAGALISWGTALKRYVRENKNS
jgi:hypothetical protein